MINNLNHLSDIEYSSNKISEALNFCNKNNVIGMYDGLPYCLIDEKFRMSLDNLRTNYFFYMTEYFENDFYRTRDGYKIYEKIKIV